MKQLQIIDSIQFVSASPGDIFSVKFPWHGGAGFIFFGAVGESVEAVLAQVVDGTTLEATILNLSPVEAAKLYAFTALSGMLHLAIMPNGTDMRAGAVYVLWDETIS